MIGLRRPVGEGRDVHHDSGSSIADLVRSATVVVIACPDGQNGRRTQRFESLGSGFFVAKQRVLTCAHVIGLRRDDLWLAWNGRLWKASVNMDPDPADASPVPFPDTAVLAIHEIDPHPTVPLDDQSPREGDELWAYGVSLARVGIVEPDNSLLQYVGPWVVRRRPALQADWQLDQQGPEWRSAAQLGHLRRVRHGQVHDA